METVFDLFVRYYSEKKDGECKREVIQGIHDYLDSIQLTEESINAERIALREWMRFKLMPVDKLEQFFRCFSLRSELEESVFTARRYALQRVKTGAEVSDSARKGLVQNFYKNAEALILQPGYEGWLHEMETEFGDSLAYASGKSDELPSAVFELIEAEKESNVK